MVIVQDFLMASQFRRALLTCLFEIFEVPLVLCLPKEACALTLTGATSGIVLDIGERETRAMPVFEGHLISSAFINNGLGMADARKALATLIVDRRQDLVASLDADSFGNTDGLAEQLSGTKLEDADQTWLRDLICRLGSVHSKTTAAAVQAEQVRLRCSCISDRIFGKMFSPQLC